MPPSRIKTQHFHLSPPRTLPPLLLLLLLISCVVTIFSISSVEASPSGELRDECGHTLRRPDGWFRRHFDGTFWKNFFRHWIPFTSRKRVKMQFYLYKRDFPDCGREILLDNDESLACSGFDAKHPTRIIIHGWMSQSKGSLNRIVKSAYLNLTKTTTTTNEAIETMTNVTLKTATEMPTTDETTADTTTADTTTADTTTADRTTADTTTADTTTDDTTTADTTTADRTTNDTTTATTKTTADRTQSNGSETRDFNIIVVDWSLISTNVNYFGVVEMIDDLGFLMAEFLRFLHLHGNLHFGDVYLIGHSLGAQIAGSTGKQLNPYRIDTIYALDPAGPKFRDSNVEQRLDASDADYVESIQTSSSLGFEEPIGHATFYPNYGKSQKNCFIYGCSHRRAYRYFAESITSTVGFWGQPCERRDDDVWLIIDSKAEYRMGGEPSTAKTGTFYVKTNNHSPYALGRRKPLEEEIVVSELPNLAENLLTD